MDNIKRCYTSEYLRDLMYKTELTELRIKVKNNTLTKEEYYKAQFSIKDKSVIIWQQLKEKNQKFFDRDGYIDIEYLKDKKQYARVKLGRGQPKKDIKKDNIIHIRLSDEEQELLNNYCNTNNITPSNAIRSLILKA